MTHNIHEQLIFTAEGLDQCPTGFLYIVTVFKQTKRTQENKSRQEQHIRWKKWRSWQRGLSGAKWINHNGPDWRIEFLGEDSPQQAQCNTSANCYHWIIYWWQLLTSVCGLTVKDIHDFRYTSQFFENRTPKSGSGVKQIQISKDKNSLFSEWEKLPSAQHTTVKIKWAVLISPWEMKQSEESKKQKK